MQDEKEQFQHLDRVLYNAQLRRTADLLGWLKQFLKRRQTRAARQASLQPSRRQVRRSAVPRRVDRGACSGTATTALTIRSPQRPYLQPADDSRETCRHLSH